MQPLHAIGGTDQTPMGSWEQEIRQSFRAVHSRPFGQAGGDFPDLLNPFLQLSVSGRKMFTLLLEANTLVKIVVRIEIWLFYG